LARIGLLLERDWTQVRRWRQRAVREGLLRPAGHYVPHRRAGQYFYVESPTRADFTKSQCPTRTPVPLGPKVPLTTPTSGLVGHPQESDPSGTPAEHGDRESVGYVEGWL